jgi:hypothetical protein
MTAASVKRLQASFDSIVSRGPLMTDRFYQVLLTENPGLRTALPANLAASKRGFVESLMQLIDCLPPNGIQAAGVAPAGFGTGRLTLHAVAREALLDVFAEITGSEWSVELRRAWREALDLLPLAEIVTGGIPAAGSWPARRDSRHPPN